MNNFDITALEDTVIGIIRDLGISKKVYPNRPKTSEYTNDFVIAMVSGEVKDKGVYGECMMSVYFFAKDVDSIKNGKKLSAMYRKFVAGFPASSGKYLFEITPTITSDVADDYGYHRRLLRIKTTIKAI